MDFSKLLKPEAVKVLTSASSKKRLMQELGDLMFVAHGLEADRVVEALNAREALGPTGVGHGVALPHARLTGLQEVVGAFVLLDSPIDFASVDRQPVDLAFALFAPEDAGVEHLKALALVSRTLRDTSICNKLRANRDAGTLHTILTEEKSAQAA
ncbi:PTS transporter subunit EIIA [Sulfitobacter sp. M57]|uniref:PTS sugar transporter subunit IIA n=1 Tax=unclassified Sulfitobacter TaxID=196795 RepID=UPI0023E1E618|nr:MULTISPECIES: PTS sugar transporter subunit IIA [unclassified Sulfitobacter]MDF3414921.1 PTS transporter subunit EIIA [Sulfitobacter sp. KE5]MDF3422402.1 PTS transporter subunit EIIA [Sulfitobacter sp. KE43]MDF3433467.1 PTS transporter subunit EIIA [Sulfitobacter sp. KE42]MDF3459107.1 PTS transporter subunit EIIA [Sulfitobacter sp. S74]MDF3463006.1 PTS transporter subunit EIIA [Sulfitobacter sp. Ks18]